MKSSRKILLENIFSLAFLQIVNMALPLITIPYLVRVLGVDKFGLVNFATSFILYFGLITDYGFNLSAVRDISTVREDNKQVNLIFSSVYLIKAALIVLSFILMCIILLSVERFRADYILYLILFGQVIGSAIFPQWLFQAFEKMKYITIVNMVVKLISTGLIFALIKTQDDYTYWACLNSLSIIITGLVCLFMAFKVLKVKLVLPSKLILIAQVKSGWTIFASTLAISLYTISNTFILGLFTNNTIVGYYSGADKIIKALQSVFFIPISQSVYPRISNLTKQSKTEALNFMSRILNLLTPAFLLITLFVIISAKQSVNILLGSNFSQSVPVLIILSFTFVLVFLSNIFGIQTMLNFNMQKEFSRILILASALCITLSFIVVPLWQHIGTALAVLATELFVTLSMFIVLKKNGITYAWRYNVL